MLKPAASGGVTRSSLGTNSSDGAASVCECSMHFSQERLASRSVEVVQEIGQQHEVVTTAEFDIESTAFDGVVTIGDSRFLCVLLCYFEDGFPVERRDLAWGLFFANAMPKRPCPAAMSRIFNLRSAFGSTSLAINCDGRSISAAIARANVTNWIIRTDGAVVRHRRAAFAHRFAMYFSRQ